MTFNQVIQRIRTISLAHKQVNAFEKGLVSDFTSGKKTTLYPAVFLQDNGGSISLAGHASTLNYRLFFADLVHVSEDTKNNEDDVLSDMISVAMDVLAQMNHGDFNDWVISAENSLGLFVETDGDMYAGCVVDISIRIVYNQNVCAVPSQLMSYTATSGQRMRVTVSEDLVTGELTLLFTKLPIEYNVPTDQDIIITDFLKGLVLKADTGSQIRLTAHEEVGTGELQLMLTKL